MDKSADKNTVQFVRTSKKMSFHGFNILGKVCQVNRFMAECGYDCYAVAGNNG